MVNQDIYTLAIQVGKKLSEHNLKLVTIESCTGGLLAGTMTAVAGSSVFFERGYITYSNESKMELVGVGEVILQQYGAVSAEVVKAMVGGGLKKSQAQVGVAVTGIAGPGGGTPQKPVGTVYFAFQVLDQPPIIFLKHFSGSRDDIRWQAVQFALEQLLQLGY